MSLGEERLGAETADGDGEARGEERELPAIFRAVREAEELGERRRDGRVSPRCSLGRLGRRHVLQPISRYGMGDEANEGGAELSGMVDAVGVAHRGDVL